MVVVVVVVVVGVKLKLMIQVEAKSQLSLRSRSARRRDISFSASDCVGCGNPTAKLKSITTFECRKSSENPP